ncbi:MAG: class I SAM-dependent methyltransferase [Proteobacteria bacterium]|nr:class I SAM-dependent methyltransferase [Pseudomonadota bacterium]
MEKTSPICRSCEQPDLEVFLDLGRTPLSDRLLTEEQLKEPEPFYPLQVAFCPNCNLVQILETVRPEVLFCDDYPYYSSFSDALLKHSRENALDLIKSRNLNTNSFVVELASNDGYLLKNYVESGIPCLGIDPAEGPAQAAEKIGVPTQITFFTEDLAVKMREEGRSADVIHANNVLAHIEDTNGFVEGLRILLKENGVAVIEVPYLKELIEHCEFDTIYHEHLCYFSVTALDNLFKSHSLFLNKVKRLSIHGGSLRLFVEKKEQIDPSVVELLQEERAQKVDRIDFYVDFSTRVHHIKDSLLRLLSTLKADGKKIAAYGAAAKGSTLINYVGIGKDLVEFVVDRNVHKQGCYMPGQHIPICAPEKLLEDRPDYVLLLAWNFAGEILQQQSEYLSRGGKFIVPIPEPKIL